MENLPTSRAAAILAGSKFYYSGRVCPSGHDSKRHVKDWQCYECRLIDRAEQARRRQARVGYKKRDQAANSILHHTRRYMLKPSHLNRFSRKLGCNGVTLRSYMERLFQPGMSWENYGAAADQWQIDHKVALDKFDLSDPIQYAAAAHYTNLQPLWRRDNAIKHTE